MILIDATHINSFGGKTILELFITKFLKLNIEYYFLLDNRLKSKLVENIKTDNFTFIDATHLSRRNFYLKNLEFFKGPGNLSILGS